MAFSLARNFLDVFYAPFTQKACEDIPETDWVNLVFLDSEESGFGTVELIDFLRSKNPTGSSLESLVRELQVGFVKHKKSCS